MNCANCHRKIKAKGANKFKKRGKWYHKNCPNTPLGISIARFLRGKQSIDVKYINA